MSHEKKLNYLRNDHLAEEAGEKAQKNISFRREKNSKVISYLVKTGYSKLLGNKEYKSHSEEEK